MINSYDGLTIFYIEKNMYFLVFVLSESLWRVPGPHDPCMAALVFGGGGEGAYFRGYRLDQESFWFRSYFSKIYSEVFFN